MRYLALRSDATRRQRQNMATAHRVTPRFDVVLRQTRVSRWSGPHANSTSLASVGITTPSRLFNQQLHSCPVHIFRIIVRHMFLNLLGLYSTNTDRTNTASGCVAFMFNCSPHVRTLLFTRDECCSVSGDPAAVFQTSSQTLVDDVIAAKVCLPLVQPR